MSNTYWSRHLEPFSSEDVKKYAKLVSMAREGCRLIMTAEGCKEIPQQEYEDMLIAHWKTLGREWVYLEMEQLLNGARKK